MSITYYGVYDIPHGAFRTGWVDTDYMSLYKGAVEHSAYFIMSEADESEGEDEEYFKKWTNEDFLSTFGFEIRRISKAQAYVIEHGKDYELTTYVDVPYRTIKHKLR